MHFFQRVTVKRGFLKCLGAKTDLSGFELPKNKLKTNYVLVWFVRNDVISVSLISFEWESLLFIDLMSSLHGLMLVMGNKLQSSLTKWRLTRTHSAFAPPCPRGSAGDAILIRLHSLWKSNAMYLNTDVCLALVFSSLVFYQISAHSLDHAAAQTLHHLREGLLQRLFWALLIDQVQNHLFCRMWRSESRKCLWKPSSCERRDTNNTE